MERWRERLIEEADEALTGFLDECPEADRPQLRNLICAAQRDRDKGKPDSARKLFHFLREELDRAGRV